MTGGFPAQTAEWTKKRGVQYAFADDTGYSLAGPFDVYGLPHAVVVAPTGSVLYSGPSDGVTEALLKEHLDGALAKPLFKLPDAVASVRDALIRGDLVAARKAALALPADAEGLADAKDALDKLRALKLKGVESAVAAGDLLGVETLAAALEPACADRPEDAARIAAAKKAAAEAPRAAERLAAQKRIRELRAVPSSKEIAEANLAELRKLAETFAGTPVEREARLAARFMARIGEAL